MARACSLRNRVNDESHGQGNDMKPKRQSRPKVRVEFSAEKLLSEASKGQRYNAIRFLALADIAGGERCDKVAKRYGVSKAAVYSWIQRLNERGIEAFNQRPRRGRKCHLDNQDSVVVDDLASAAKAASERASKKLMAISRLLEQVPCGEVAREAKVTPSTLTAWIKKFNKGGIPELVANNQMLSRSKIDMRRDISTSDVREASKTASHRTSRRLTAVAHVLDGMKLADVAKSLNVSIAAVSKWCRRFNQEGMEGLIDRWDARAGRVPKATISSRKSWPS